MSRSPVGEPLGPPSPADYAAPPPTSSQRQKSDEGSQENGSRPCKAAKADGLEGDEPKDAGRGRGQHGGVGVASRDGDTGGLGLDSSGSLRPRDGGAWPRLVSVPRYPHARISPTALCVTVSVLTGAFTFYIQHNLLTARGARPVGGDAASGAFGAAGSARRSGVTSNVACET